MKKIISISLLSICLLGCQTPYQADSFRGGYSETKLNDSMYSVTFRGNGFTDEDTVNKYLLKRASELTLQNGYRYFAVIDSHENVEQYTHQSPTTYTNTDQGFYGSGQYSSYQSGTVFHGNTTTLDAYTNRIIIKMFKTQSKDGNLLDASMIH